MFFITMNWKTKYPNIRQTTLHRASVNTICAWLSIGNFYPTMHLFITMVLMGAANLVMCDPDLPPNYSPNCVPPNGTIPTTTPSSGSTSVAPYLGLLPIERCCPACEDCIHVGGHCKLRWLPDLYPEWCDFTSIPECRDYSCTCCVKCSDDKCSDCTQTGGECRVDCRAGEIEDNNNKCSYHATADRAEGCKCCKKCEATSECTDALGKCVTDPADCPYGSFASTGCCGGCYCCKPVLEGTHGPSGGPDGCSENGAYCSEEDDCATGFYSCFGLCEKTQHVNGLVQKVAGYCCVPKSVNGGTVGRRRSVDTFVKQMIGHETRPPHGYGRIKDQF